MELTMSILDNEIFTTEYFVQNNICTFCWIQPGDDEVFHMKQGDFEETTPNNLLDMIVYCLDINLSTNIMPKKICQSCLLNVEKFHSFKKNCQETHRRLLDMFESKNSDRSLVIQINPSILKVENAENIILDHSISKNETMDIIDSPDDATDSDEDGSDAEIPLNKLKQKLSDTETKVTVSKTKMANRRSKKKITISKSQAKKYNRSPTMCSVCFLDFKTEEKFKIHISMAHGIEDEGYRCFGCDRLFKTRRGRVGHETGFCKNLIRGFKCQKCERYLQSRGAYEKHVKDHRTKDSEEWSDDVMKCSKCEETFQSLEALRKHRDIHSVRKKEFICEVCGKVFSRRTYLYMHGFSHSTDKQFKCSQCNYASTLKSSLKVHIRKHTGERPFACDLCPQQCVSSSNLQAHRRRHFGIKNFQCILCDKKFGYKTSLQEHFASVHDRSHSFTCKMCAEPFPRRCDLKRHLQAAHGREYKKIVRRKEGKRRQLILPALKNATDIE